MPKQNKKRAMFVMASIRSHIIPTLYLAEILAKDYDIYYAVSTSILRDIVIKNGFKPVSSVHAKLGTPFELPFLELHRERSGFWPRIYDFLTNRIYWHRKTELDELMSRIQPELVLVDIFGSIDFFALYSYWNTTKILFCNPMLSTHKVDNIPHVTDPNMTEYSSASSTGGFKLTNWLKNPKTEIYRSIRGYHLNRLMQIVKLAPEHCLIDTPYIRLFANVPELLLAPLELEITQHVRKSHQHYLGLCIRTGRQDTEQDPEFVKHWHRIMKLKSEGQRIIYCSFGTFYAGSNKTLLSFVKRLLDAISVITNVQLICSVNHLVIETLCAQKTLPENVMFFRRVPQLMVLQHAALHLTHGGLGSVKESIYYGVPMLVYPLDSENDQPGNSLKVEYHGLGLRGDSRWDAADNIRTKIMRLLEDISFKNNICQFQKECSMNYASDQIDNMLRNLLSQ